VVKDAMAFLNKKRKRKKKWGGDRKSTKFRAMEFAAEDCKGATSIEDTFIRVSAMVSMTSCAAKDTRKLDKGPQVLCGAVKTSLIGFSSILAIYV
jgi:hypothetical protein